jgi:hypothetical protein
MKFLRNLREPPSRGSRRMPKTSNRPDICARPETALLSCRPWSVRKRRDSARFRRCALAVHIGLLRMLEDLRWGRNDTGTRRSGLGGRSMSRPGARAAFRDANTAANIGSARRRSRAD